MQSAVIVILFYLFETCFAFAFAVDSFLAADVENFTLLSFEI